MNGFLGADTEALRTIGSVYSRRAEALSDLESLLASTIDNVEWIGEDAERFHADWTGIVRPGLQDQEFELRHHARRLTQHADEQDAASAPDGPLFGGGGWSSPGEFLRDLAQRADDLLDDLLGRQDGPLADLLRDLFSTPEGRAAFLGAFLGTLLGGMLADMIAKAALLGIALENLLTGLGAAGGLSNLIGESTQAGTSEALAAQPAQPTGGQGGEAGADGGDAAGGDTAGGDAGGGSGGGAGGSSDGSGSGGGAGSGGGSAGGGGGAAEGAGAAGAESSADAGAADAPVAGRPLGLQGEYGPAQSGGSHLSGRIVASDDQGPTSLLERLMEMFADVMAPGDGSGAAVGNDIGHDIGVSGTRR